MSDSSTLSDSVAQGLRVPWVITGSMVFSLMMYLSLAHLAGAELQGTISLMEEQRILIRTVLYIVAIITLPMTNLLRHVMLRLNQTMPGPYSAARRYLVTVVVSMAMVETIGLYGLIMFVLGDDFNNLYIFTGMSALGMYLYRPKASEYRSIVEARSDTEKGPSER